MAEYIEREAAYEKCGWYNTVNGKSICAVRKDELACIPAADVVPVVRCKDCWNTTEVDGHMGTVLYCHVCDRDVDEEHFCSYGERKDGAE